MKDNLVDETEKRDKVIKIRCTAEEYSALKVRSKKFHLAKWMREHCLDVTPPRPLKLPAVSPELQRQLTGMGNNLNQIARAVNREQWQALDHSRVIQSLINIERELELIKQAHSHDR